MAHFFMTFFKFRLVTALTSVLALLNASIAPAFAQDAEPSAVLTRPQIERLVAPIALYPDAVLTHVLMAATYPFEVVQAARWSDANPDVTGPAVEDAMQDQSWDESVKALAAFPQILKMMNEKLDWTQALGEAFLAQQEDVFAAVQDLRQRADAAGNLKTSKEMRVSRIVDDRGLNVTTIEPAGDDEIYVPVYDPYVAYGAWPYPDDPPYFWYPHNWHRDRLFWYGGVVVVGVALWAAWDWRRRSITVNPQRFNAFNRTKIAQPNWAFNAHHRKGVPFKAPALTQKFGPIAKPTPRQRAILRQTPLTGNPALKGPAGKNVPTAIRGTKNRPVTTNPTNITKASGTHSAAPIKRLPGSISAPDHKATVHTAPVHKAPVHTAPAHKPPVHITQPQNRNQVQTHQRAPQVRSNPAPHAPSVVKKYVPPPPPAKKPVPPPPNH